MNPQDDRTKDERVTGLADVLQYWLEWNEEGHREDGTTVTDDMHVIPPVWPTRGVIKEWIRVINQANPEPRPRCEMHNFGPDGEGRLAMQAMKLRRIITLPFALLLRFFGYAKVPREVSLLAGNILLRWRTNPADPVIGRGLETLARFWRSTQ